MNREEFAQELCCSLERLVQDIGHSRSSSKQAFLNYLCPSACEAVDPWASMGSSRWPNHKTMNLRREELETSRHTFLRNWIVSVKRNTLLITAPIPPTNCSSAPGARRMKTLWERGWQFCWWQHKGSVCSCKEAPRAPRAGRYWAWPWSVGKAPETDPCSVLAPCTPPHSGPCHSARGLELLLPGSAVVPLSVQSDWQPFLHDAFNSARPPGKLLFWERIFEKHPSEISSDGNDENISFLFFPFAYFLPLCRHFTLFFMLPSHSGQLGHQDFSLLLVKVLQKHFHREVTRI